MREFFAEDKLFATLDPTTRQYMLPGGTKILLTDTVGFIRNLPHHLIKAFKSTLDEAVWADVLMIVCDASDGDFAGHLGVTEKLLEELGAAGKPTLYVFNKCDCLENEDKLAQMRRIAGDANGAFVFVSAKTERVWICCPRNWNSLPIRAEKKCICCCRLAQGTNSMNCTGQEKMCRWNTETMGFM